MNIIGEVMVYCYMKYMMDKLYYQYTEVIIYYGLFGLIVNLCAIKGLEIFKYEKKIDI